MGGTLSRQLRAKGGTRGLIPSRFRGVVDWHWPDAETVGQYFMGSESSRGASERALRILVVVGHASCDPADRDHNDNDAHSASWIAGDRRLDDDY